jgi:hypothetical protein
MTHHGFYLPAHRKSTAPALGHILRFFPRFREGSGRNGMMGAKKGSPAFENLID